MRRRVGEREGEKWGKERERKRIQEYDNMLHCYYLLRVGCPKENLIQPMITQLDWDPPSS